MYLLTYNLRLHFDKESFEKKAGIKISSVSDDDLVNAIFYNTLLSIIENEIEGVKEEEEEEVPIDSDY